MSSRHLVTSDDLSALISIVNWFCLVVVILTISVRFLTKFWTARRIDLDDVFIASSTIFAIAQSIAVFVGTSNRLGKRLDLSSASQNASTMKAQYAAELLFVLACCFAKLSLAAFLQRLSPLRLNKMLCFVAEGMTALWALTSFLSLAFQCRLPHPWDYLGNVCVNRTALGNYIIVVNIITDVFLIGLPLHITAHLKVAKRVRLFLALVFMSRTSTIAAEICQAVYLNRLNVRSDPLLDIWRLELCTQVVQCLSILTACTVYLKTFIDSLESGFIQLGDLRRQHGEGFGYTYVAKSTTKGGGGGKEGKGSKETRKSNDLKKGSTITSDLSSQPLQPIELQPVVVRPRGEAQDDRGQSQILQTTTWSVEEAYI